MSYSNDEHFCSNKLLLEAKEASFLDIILLLFSSDIKKRKFVDCSEEQRYQNFPRRWIIFISILAQWFLILFRKPMALVGLVIEWWLNLLSDNGGFFGLLLNILRGRVVIPDPTSATFTSVVGSLDKRVDLDKNIGVGSKRYIGSLSLMAAKLAYENEAFVASVVKDHLKMEFKGFYNFWNGRLHQLSTPAFILQDSIADPDLIVLAFRGTDPFDANGWITDIDISWYELKGVGKVHRGFMYALGMQKNGWPKDIDQGATDHSYAYYSLRQMLRNMLQKNEKAKFIVAGHSLGGALAILFICVLAFHEEAWLFKRLEGVYTFGQPRVGDKQFEEYMEDKLRKYDVRYLRYVYSNDLVPRIPFDDKTLMYKHFGPCLFYNSCYRGKVLREEPNKNYFSLLWFIPKRVNAGWELVLREEPNKNYFSLLWFIPKRVNAGWELVRSFILPIVKGRDYRETWLLTLVRIFGLAIPGIANHCPQDYNNSTRLGNLPVAVDLQYSYEEIHGE
ncbi:hypothetical protein Tsubulata_034499 [Turnera subulata]|uniref:Fungal lipase-type domain-containing protein n=1 Tax=Turnera subulata TaxID=218843 RepID=A0A9Q0FQN5_9ROSI|nr:hypothetical protein Tsubulata_034499 [Turnera subulata]